MQLEKSQQSKPEGTRSISKEEGTPNNDNNGNKIAADSQAKGLQGADPGGENTHFSMHTLEFEKETVIVGGDSEKAELAGGGASDDRAKE